MNEIWQKLSELMARNGLSKSDLARVAGVTPSAVTSWSHGGHISPAITKRLSDHFKCDLTGFISNLIPPKSAMVMAESREKYGSDHVADPLFLTEEIKKLSARMSAIEQLLIRVLAEKEKK